MLMLPHKKYGILFEAAMLNHAKDVGAEQAVNDLLETLTRRLRGEERSDVLEMLYDDLNIMTEPHPDGSEFNNEDYLRTKLTKRLEALLADKATLHGSSAYTKLR